MTPESPRPETAPSPDSAGLRRDIRALGGLLGETLVHSVGGFDEEGLAILYEADGIALADHDHACRAERLERVGTGLADVGQRHAQRGTGRHGGGPFRAALVQCQGRGTAELGQLGLAALQRALQVARAHSNMPIAIQLGHDLLAGDEAVEPAVGLGCVVVDRQIGRAHV